MNFLRYCASCHGVEGKGNGTASRSLKVKAADLTALKKNNNGAFRLEKVIATINGKTRVEAHGEEDAGMGEIFKKKASRQKNSGDISTEKINALAQYIETIHRWKNVNRSPTGQNIQVIHHHPDSQPTNLGDSERFLSISVVGPVARL